MPRGTTAQSGVRPGERPQAGAEPGPEEESPPAKAATVESTMERTPRLDWAGLLRRTFALDVFACVRCGGRRRVLAYLTAPGGGARHSGAPGIALAACEAGPGTGSTPERVVLSPCTHSDLEAHAPAACRLAGPLGPACAPRGGTASAPARRTARVSPSSGPSWPLFTNPPPSTGLLSVLYFGKGVTIMYRTQGLPSGSAGTCTAPDC